MNTQTLKNKSFSLILRLSVSFSSDLITFITEGTNSPRKKMSHRPQTVEVRGHVECRYLSCPLLRMEERNAARRTGTEPSCQTSSGFHKVKTQMALSRVLASAKAKY